MHLTFQIAGADYRFDTVAAHDISIPLDFYGDQPNAFHLPRASSEVVEAGNFVGDTRRGGGCNCETFTMNPHGNGTHTECIGHLSHARVMVTQLLRESFMPALLLSVPVRQSADENEGVIEKNDLVVTRGALEEAVAALGDIPREFFTALIIRTLPNDPGKMSALYSGSNPCYISSAAMRFVRSLGVEHLLVDLPSVDREEDQGVLAAHRIFWDAPEESHDIPEPYSSRTITEMVYANSSIPDGLYMLDLQIPSLLLDAAPSRPFLYAITRMD
jgi:hypothetical protein